MSQTLMSDWRPVFAPPDEPAPRPLVVRAQSLPARAYFPEHRHDWAQVVYAISGVLTVSTQGRSYLISPDQAVWLPPGVPHRVGALFGAEFRSLWIAESAVRGLADDVTVFGVTALTRALIAEAAALGRDDNEQGYRGRVFDLLLDQLRRAAPLPGALPWPESERLNRLCQALYRDPANTQSEEAWAHELGMSGRTLRRRFDAEVGMSLRSWRRRMRLFRAVELLASGLDVTATALELGYASPSAFIYAFRTGMGASPQAYIRKGGAPR